eukprot:tig00000215_g18547.t1
MSSATAAGSFFVVRAVDQNSQAGDSAPVAGQPAVPGMSAAPHRDAPSNLQLSSISFGLLGGRSGVLSWNRPAAGPANSYVVMKDGELLGTTAPGQTQFEVSGLPRDRAAVFQVIPVGDNGVAGPPSYPLVAGSAGSDSGITLTVAPAAADGSAAQLAWTAPAAAAAASAGAITGYVVMLNGQQIATVPATGAGVSRYAARGLRTGARSVFSVAPLYSKNAYGTPELEMSSNTIPLFVAPNGTSADFGATINAPSPSAPGNLQLTAISSGLFGGASGTLNWSSPASGSGALSAFIIFMGGRAIGTTAAADGQTQFEVSGLPRDRATVFQVVPVGDNGVAGPPSYPLVAGSAGSDSGITLTVAPAAADGSAAQLAWTAPAAAAAASAGAITGYVVMLNGQQIATVPATGAGAGVTRYTARGLRAGARSVFTVAPLTSSGHSGEASSNAVPLVLGFGPAVTGLLMGTVAIGNARGSRNAPSNLRLTGVSTGLLGGTSGTLSWNAPTAGLGTPEAYQVVKDGKAIATVKGGRTSLAVSGLSRDGLNQLVVVPIWPGGAAGEASHPYIYTRDGYKAEASSAYLDGDAHNVSL